MRYFKLSFTSGSGNVCRTTHCKRYINDLKMVISARARTRFHFLRWTVLSSHHFLVKSITKSPTFCFNSPKCAVQSSYDCNFEIFIATEYNTFWWLETEKLGIWMMTSPRKKKRWVEWTARLRFTCIKSLLPLNWLRIGMFVYSHRQSTWHWRNLCVPPLVADQPNDKVC